MPVRRSTSYSWRLREVMAAHGVWKTTDLVPLLAERGIVLSTAQTYRLVAKTPERLSLSTLSALCDIFACTPTDLIGVDAGAPPRPGPGEGTSIDLAARRRPRRARVDPRR